MLEDIAPILGAVILQPRASDFFTMTTFTACPTFDTHIAIRQWAGNDWRAS